MSRTGIGFAGIEGAWWLPAAQPFVLHRRLAEDLERIAQAIFTLFDTVSDMYGTAAGAAGGLNQLLEYKVPAGIPRLCGPGRVLTVRPDFQLRPLGQTPHYQLVATELEICPSAHGFAHAMQVGYGLPTDLVAALAHMLGGRELLFVGASQWSEFLFEQLAFCRALTEVGARARVLYDVPATTIAERVRRGECWRPPMFGISELPARWHADVMRRIQEHGFAPLLFPDDGGWPDQVGDALIFRFGYFDCFRAEQLQRLLVWQAGGATFLNPTRFFLDSKVVLAALQLPAVRQQIAGRAPNALATLDDCIPETLLVRPEISAQLRREQPDWVLKYAGYDGGDQAWGGRSLRVGRLHTPDDWAGILESCLALAWPVVAQRLVPTARIDIAYLDTGDQTQWMRQGATRLRSFMLRDSAAVVCGSHLTVSGGAMQVSEGTDAVQAPIIFRE
jgi:hypothetical protein